MLTIKNISQKIEGGGDENKRPIAATAETPVQRIIREKEIENPPHRQRSSSKKRVIIVRKRKNRDGSVETERK